jgi:hypothetical protein
VRAAPPATPWLAAGTPREGAGGFTWPVARRLVGQLLECAVALVLPEDRDQDAGQERARATG